jgi:ubiquinone/menaquinone biosynthesis C-methylase UbiE
MINIPKFLYENAVHLMSNLGAYKERTDKYVDAFKNYINNTGTILDAGCGSGEFARKLAKKHNRSTRHTKTTPKGNKGRKHPQNMRRCTISPS